ncbi:MAG: polyprenyl synthetase family protein [Chloroflexota bacterium]|nr:polyprenyl synthetase family protein [Chloroflexota bacterium]
MERMETALGFYAPIADGLRRVEESLEEVASGSEDPIKGLLEHVVAVQGKRVRPSITLLVSKILGCDTDKPAIMGAAVELLHLATLIHDDTVDNADVRRGRATLSSLWGPEVAVLVGDYLFATSAIHVCNTENIRVIKGFSRTIMDLSSGQLTEHFMANQWQQTREQYYDRIFKKTGSLFATAAESGAILSGADERTIEAFRTFGSNLGTAFQVVDDILDFEGSAEEIGKPVGSDLASGVLTLPALLLVERYPRDNPVVAVCEGVEREANMELAVDMVRNSGVMADVYAEAGALRARAIDALAPLPDSEAKRALLELSDFVLERHV